VVGYEASDGASDRVGELAYQVGRAGEAQVCGFVLQPQERILAPLAWHDQGRSVATRMGSGLFIVQRELSFAQETMVIRFRLTMNSSAS
jgi:hypothetical protein